VDLIVLVLVLCVIGFVVWLITTKIPMDPTVRLAIQILAALVLILYVLRRLAILPNVL
jgi:hypothetical protein